MKLVVREEVIVNAAKAEVGVVAAVCARDRPLFTKVGEDSTIINSLQVVLCCFFSLCDDQNLPTIYYASMNLY